MQSFIDIPSTDSLQNSRLKLINNDKTIMSCHSGTAFPTSNLEIGMFCFRTDLNQLYELKNLTPTWVLAADLNKTYTNKEYVDELISNHGNHVPTTQAANNKKFLRNDNTWQDVTPENIGAAAATHNQDASTITTGTLPTARGGTGNTTNTSAACSGNAATATKLQTGRVISLTGGVTGSTTFDGSGNVSIAATVVPSATNQAITATKQALSSSFNTKNVLLWSSTSSATTSAAAGTPANFPVTPDSTTTDSAFNTTTKKSASETNRYNYRYLYQQIGDGIAAGTYTLAGIIQELVNRSHRHLTYGYQGHAVNNCNCDCNCSGCDN